MKLNALYIALVYQNQDTVKILQDEIIQCVKEELNVKGTYDPYTMNYIVDLSDRLICKDLLQEETLTFVTYPRKVLSIAFNDSQILEKKGILKIKIYRPKEIVSLCYYHLLPDGKKDFSLQNLTRFFEVGGMGALVNKAEIITK